LILLVPIISIGQNDTITLKNNDVIVGEVKSLSKSIMIVETSYSDEDFKIEFNKVIELQIERNCFIILTHGRRRFGKIRTEGTNNAVITLENGNEERFDLHEIIMLQTIDEKFFQRISAAIDLGYNLTKANSNSQFTISGKLNYTDEKWMFDAAINVLNSSQNDVEDISRTDASLELRRILPSRWYLLGNVSFLSNTEQALEGRISNSLGAGKLLISSTKLYLGLAGGINYNIENFTDSTPDRTSLEAFTSLTYDMFDFKDFDLNSGLKIYPSLSESKRIRLDYNLNLKYDLPLDFYIKLGFTLNYDNQPADEGNEIDYIFTSGFGWEFN
jgi:putative salt-induced outer membrane protein YdiY